MSSQQSKSAGIRSASTSTSSNEASSSGPIDIEIRGQRLTIRSDRDPAFVQKLASYIDRTFEELQTAAPSAPYNKLLMLASMTVAEELFETRQELDEMRDQLQETTESMFDLLDQVELDET